MERLRRDLDMREKVCKARCLETTLLWSGVHLLAGINMNLE